MKAVCQDVMALRALVGDECFNRRCQSRAVPRRACSDERYKKVASRHETYAPTFAPFQRTLTRPWGKGNPLVVAFLSA